MPSGAPDRARLMDGRLEQSLTSLVLPCSRDVVSQLRGYLLKQNASMGLRNNVYSGLRKITSHDLVYITLGPQFDKGPTESHFYLESGARFSFGITLREGNGRCALVEYRFHLHLAEGSSPPFYRFDLNEKPHHSPLVEPRCHMHPGSDDIRLPCPPLTPLDVLDRIFFVIEPSLPG